MKKPKQEPKKEIFDLVQEDENGFVDMKKFYNENPDIKQRMISKLKDRQEMVIDSINQNDLISAGLKDKAITSRILGEEVLDLEVGRQGSNLNILIEQRPIYSGKSLETIEEVKQIEEEVK